MGAHQWTCGTRLVIDSTCALRVAVTRLWPVQHDVKEGPFSFNGLRLSSLVEWCCSLGFFQKGSLSDELRTEFQLSRDADLCRDGTW